MVLRGHIHNGAIALDEPQTLREGVAVEVSILPPQRASNPRLARPRAGAV